MNPYQGCEHGCVYCYARNTHPFWGYSAGLDFENNILVKSDAHKLLEKQIRKKSWVGEPICCPEIRIATNRPNGNTN